ncbi:MAG TPA: Hsp20/alpha crystallin family protein [candidate division Zixibacteria bacterium]|nr:Hsp20/alpha crystallin family protein [candidate division Zixibacteria bacterium]
MGSIGGWSRDNRKAYILAKILIILVVIYMMGELILEKTKPLVAANSPCPCGKAAYVLDKLVGYPVTPNIPTLPEMFESGTQITYVPEVGMNEDENTFELHVQIPGVKRDDIKIQPEGNTLLVTATRAPCLVGKTSPEISRVASTKKEPKVQYNARIFIPGNVDMDSLNAVLHAGMLAIIFKKKKYEHRPVEIK